MKRYGYAALYAVILVFSLSVCIVPAAAAGDSGYTAMLPVNETSLTALSAHGTAIPRSVLENDGSIMLFHIEDPQTGYPAQRSMAFGPRYIQMTTNLPTLAILGACMGIAALGFFLYRRRGPLPAVGIAD